MIFEERKETRQEEDYQPVAQFLRPRIQGSEL